MSESLSCLRQFVNYFEKKSKNIFRYEKTCLELTNLPVVFIYRSDNFIEIYIFLII